MAKKDSVSTADRLAALMADRERFQLWLNSLDGERDTIPDHVYTRVRGDYAERLDEVTEELASHVEALRSMLVRRQEAMDDADAAVSARTDELLEAEVRFRIGEFEDGEWAKAERRLKQRVAEAEKVRDKLNGQIERLASALEQLAADRVDSTGDAEEDAEDDAFLRRLREESAKASGESGGLPPRTNASAPKPAVKGRGPGPKKAGGAPEEPAAAKNAADPPKPLRTIECNRCGTFNFPDAAHCDACGQELAA